MGFGFKTCRGRLCRKANAENPRGPAGTVRHHDIGSTERLPKTVKRKAQGEKFTSKKLPGPKSAASAPNLSASNYSKDNLRRTKSTATLASNQEPPLPHMDRLKPHQGPEQIFQADDICWTNFKDHLMYRWIRIKVWFKSNKKADVMDTLTFDPFTGEPVLTGSEKPSEEVEEEKETEVKCLAYSAELHAALRYFWWSINFTGRLPFRVQMEDLDLDDGVLDTLIIRLNDWGAITVNILTGFILWVLLIWVVLGHTLICIDKEIPDRLLSFNRTTPRPTGNELEIEKLRGELPEYHMLKRYWVELWFFYTTLFHLASVTTNQWIYGRDYALFFKRWYKALDRSKVKVHESLRGFYLSLNGLVGLLVIIMAILFFVRSERFPFLIRTCQIVLAGFMYPTHRIATDTHRKYANGDLYFQNFWLESLVFLLYCWIVIVAWQNSIIHLTFSRCFRNGIRLLNDRVRMVLLPLEEPQVGPNAVRITAEHVQADYAHLTAAGMAQNNVFGFAIMSDMMWTLLTLFFEMMALTFYGVQDPAGPEHMFRFSHKYYDGTNIPLVDPAWPYILNAMGHAGVTTLRLWIVVWFPDLVFREAQLGYRAVTSKGLLSCSNQLQRNFVRSMWLMTVPKFPIIITANNYFKLTRGMICALCAAVATFYIFAMQAKGDMSRILLGDWGFDIKKLYKDTGRELPDEDDDDDI